jgi:hypothetical protein
VILNKIVSYLLPAAIATSTMFTPQTGVFPVGVGEKHITTYLEAEYVPSTPVEVVISPQNDPRSVINEVFGKDADDAWNVALCESKGLHTNPDGTLVMGKITPDYGLMQINEVHLEAAKNKGYDIRDLQDNVRYAKLLFDSYGWQPWYSSKSCHGL